MGWRSKFVFTLIVYFAGFATAIYCLAPAPQGQGARPGAGGLFDSALKSDRLAQRVNTGIHKCVDLGKEAAVRAAQVMQERVKEAQLELEKQGRDSL